MEEQGAFDTKGTDILREIRRQSGKNGLLPEQYSALGLAYIGDAVYDLIIRTLVLSEGNYRVKTFHRRTSHIVKAGSQARLMESIEGELTEEEDHVFHRGRNAKSGSSAKNSSIIDYRIATGFEALLGYLYLEDKLDRAISLVFTGLGRTGQMRGDIHAADGSDESSCHGSGVEGSCSGSGVEGLYSGNGGGRADSMGGKDETGGNDDRGEESRA